VAKTSTYRKNRAREYMAKFRIPYTSALILVNREMLAEDFDPRQPLPDTIPPKEAT
jgi:hypothetical protein